MTERQSEGGTAIVITRFGVGVSSFSGRESDETVTCLMDGQEVTLTFPELKKFVKMRLARAAAPARGFEFSPQ